MKPNTKSSVTLYEHSSLGIDHKISVFKKLRSSFFASLGNIIIPPICLGCETHVAEQGSLCPHCWGDLRFIEKPYCAVLGTPFSFDLGDGVLSANAIASPPVFERARAVAHYDGIAKKLVQGLKFSDRTDLAPWMAHWMVRAGKELIQDSPVIVGVPLHRRRMFFRRFNQSAELARYIAAYSGQAYMPAVLQRIRATKQQVGLKMTERKANVRGAFRVPHDQKIKIAGKRVLLIDDVLTTGATLSAASRALLRGGADAVDCLTFARVASNAI